jgi:hypothetical protein
VSELRVKQVENVLLCGKQMRSAKGSATENVGTDSKPSGAAKKLLVLTRLLRFSVVQCLLCIAVASLLVFSTQSKLLLVRYVILGSELVILLLTLAAFGPLVNTAARLNTKKRLVSRVCVCVCVCVCEFDGLGNLILNAVVVCVCVCVYGAG